MIMYQDKIKKSQKAAKELLTQRLEATEELEKKRLESTDEDDKKRLEHSNIFNISTLLPLEFTPDECVDDATFIARDILSKRSNAEIVSLSNAINSMLRVGDGLLMELSMKLLKTQDSRKSVVQTQGRSLYLLHDYFNLETLPIKKVQWGELFATLTLMQSAEIIYTPYEGADYDETLREALKQTSLQCISQLKEEIIDSVARAECYFDIKAKSKNDGKVGGKTRADKMEPLRNEVGRRFLEKYTMYKKNRAALIIKAELIDEKTNLFDPDKKPNIERTFAKWIDGLLKKEWQLPVQ